MSLQKRVGMLSMLIAGSVSAQKMTLSHDLVRRWLENAKASTAAAFLDATVLLSEHERTEERIRLFLLSAVAHAQAKDFSSAYQRTRQAEELFEWGDYREGSKADPVLRNRIRASIDLVLHDIRQAEGREFGGPGS